MTLRFTEEDFAKMTAGKKHLRVAGNSASRPKAGGRSQSKTDAAKALAKAERVKNSPHAAELARLKKNPALLKGREEHFIQVELFYWLECDYPDIYDLTHSTPNSGKRGKLTAFTMQSEGQKKGYPDTSLDAARGAYHGLRVEIKTLTGAPSEEQTKVANLLRNQNYCVIFAYGLEATKQAFMDYWALLPHQTLPEIYKSEKA